MRNGEMVVVAAPLDTNPGEEPDLIRSLFERFMALSSLYKIQKDHSTLHTDVRKALSLKPTDDLQVRVVSTLMASTAGLPGPKRQEFQKRFDRALNSLKMASPLYGPEAFVFLGELELSNLVQAGGLKLTPDERSLLIKIVHDKFVDRLPEKQRISLDNIYQKSVWDKKCSFAFNRALHYGLNQQDADGISKIRSEAIRRAMSTSREIFGAKVAERLQKYFMAVDIVGPVSLDGYFKSTDFVLKAALEPWNIKEFHTVYDMLYDLRKDGDSRVDSFCSSFSYEPLHDMENGGLIILSSYSLRNYKMGLSIATHEMGHAASEGMKMLMNTGMDIGDFLRIRQCLNENYVSTGRPGTLLPGDKLWTEEDWADAFSGHSTPDLDAVATCSFFGAFPSHDFAQLKERDGDPHSSTFYRVLNVSVHSQRKIPNTCSSAVENEFPGTKFVDCLSAH